MRVPFRASWLLVGGAVGAAALLNCWSLSDPLGPDGNGGTAAGGASGGTGGGAGATHGGGGATGGGATGGGGMLPCDPAGPPLPPSSSSTSTAGGWVFAIRSVAFSLPGNKAPGFDLDDLCSCAPDPEGCAATGTPPQPHCDDWGAGRDNTLGPALDAWLVNAGLPAASAEFSTGAEDGEWTLLLEIPEVALPDDIDAGPIVARTGGACCGGAAPLWGGLDNWPVNTGFEAGTDQSTWPSESAHVTANVLVAHFPLLDIRMRHGGFWLGVRVRNAVLSASLDLGATPANLENGVISGVVSEEDLFWGLDTIQIGGYRLCVGGDFYPGAKTAVCDARDLGSGGASSRCEAVSFGLAFTATEVVPAGTVDETGGSNCSSGTRPIDDRCDEPVGGAGAFRRSR